MSKSAHSTANHTATSWWLGGLLLVIFLAIGLGSMFLQKQLRQSQESRSQASVSNGVVQIIATDTEINSGALSHIDFAINTHNVAVNEVALNFDVLLPTSVKSTPSADARLIFVTHDVSLQSLALRSSAIGAIATPLPSGQTGWRISLVASPTDLASGYSSNSSQALFRLELPMPVTAGDVQVKFDPASSHAYLWQAPTNPPAEIFPIPQDVLAILPAFNVAIGQTACNYTYSAWSACQNGLQTRTYTAQPTTCAAPDVTQLSQACLPQCHYTYSNWGSCVNGWQTRTYAQTPASCTWYATEAIQPLTKSCAPNTSSRDFSTYTYESCWATKSAGNTSYVMWNQTVFPNVTKIDVSTGSDFSSYANKDVAGATQTLGANYLVTDGTNFRTADSNHALWVFWPGYTYYFRLYYNNGQHSQVISYFVPKCAGASSVSYKLCNDTCSNNTECASNLACISGQCRRPDNSGSNVCATPPDKGLNRACNDYCANDGECGGGLKCWWNRCRLPKNLESTSCSVPVVKKVVYQAVNYTTAVSVGTGTVEAACNEPCTNNRGCAADLRCYQGSCRLPENVTNTSCLTVAAAAAVPTATLSTAPTEEPTVAPMISPIPDTNTTSWFSTTGEWLAGRLGFLVMGLIIAVIIILVWPMLRTGFVPEQTAQRPMAPMPPNAYRTQSTRTAPAAPVQPPQVHQSVSRMMTPPNSQSSATPSGSTTGPTAHLNRPVDQPQPPQAV